MTEPHRIGPVDHVPRDQSTEEVRIHATRQIVSRGDRTEGARIVVESCGVVQSRCLRRLLAKSTHPLDRIVEPPRRSESHGGIVVGKRRELSRIRRFVEREENQRQARVMSELVQQWLQVARELRRDGNVRAIVGAEAREHTRVMIAQRTRV